MNIKKIIDQFNQPNSLLVISSYPERGVTYSGRVCAVGGYAKNTIKSLNQEYKNKGKNKKFIVFTVTTNGKEEVYKERNVLVIRCIKRNNLSSFISLIRWVLKFRKVRIGLVEFEFSSFGGTHMTVGILAFLGFLKLLGKKTILVLHHVLFDLGQLSGHVGLSGNNIATKFLELGLNEFYRFAGFFSFKVIVLEEEFRKRLSKVVDPQKISVIPHGVDTSLKLMSKKISRKKLNLSSKDFVLLFFGYLTWYKGIDSLLEKVGKFRVGKRKVKLLIAGGPSFTQRKKTHYRKFLQKIYSDGEKNNVLITGFVPEDKIRLYFSASDAVILPYRTFMSSSGPLSMAMSFGKPFLLSEALLPILNTYDFRQALNYSSLTGRDTQIKFSMSAKHMQKLAKLSKKMRAMRSFGKLSSSYIRIIEEASNTLPSKYLLPAGGILKPAYDTSQI